MSEEQTNPQENLASETPSQHFPPHNGGFNMQAALPNATAVLILGILSIVSCCCYGIIGFIFSIIALILSKKDRQLYFANRGFYTESSFKNLNAGRVCAIVGLILSALCLLFFIIMIATFGWATLNDRAAMEEYFRSLQ